MAENVMFYLPRADRFQKIKKMIYSGRGAKRRKRRIVVRSASKRGFAAVHFTRSALY